MASSTCLVPRVPSSRICWRVGLPRSECASSTRPLLVILLFVRSIEMISVLRRTSPSGFMWSSEFVTAEIDSDFPAGGFRSSTT